MKKLLITILATFILAIFPKLTMAASLTLTPASGTFNKSCSFNVDIKLDTSGVQTDGTDAIVLFDQSKLTANITAGTIYATYAGTNADNNAGKITVSGLASDSSAFSGSGTLATINFTVKDTAPTGATIVKFDFDPTGASFGPDCIKSGPNTCDSNVVQRDNKTDSLSSVGNGNYVIGTGTCAAGAPAVSPTTGQGAVIAPPAVQIPVKEVPVKTLPPAGSEQFTFMVAILGSTLTVLGILGIILL